MKKILFILTLLTVLFVGCHKRVTDTHGPAKKSETNIPELPFILEGNYTPDTNQMYKVIIDSDTCFVIIDSMTDETMYGRYWKPEWGSDTVGMREFEYDRHWRERRKEALVYEYVTPPYERQDDALYRVPCKKVSVERDIEYGQALGYWCSLPIEGDDSYIEIVTEGLKRGVFKRTQSLTMDVYSPLPDDSTRSEAPLLMLIHGGGFYAGDKQDSAISAWCRHFASLGYVAVSINYRLGFLPTKNEIARTGYMALQDAHAAMRYLVEHAERFGIDTSLLFVGGASAGSITALNLAFMQDDDRPKTVKSGLRDLGGIASSGNNSQATFHIKGVANMWGAVTNLKMLKNSDASIVSFHGDADLVVPYDNGYPFADISKRIGKRMFDRMYGSYQIDMQSQKIGKRSVLYTYKGEGHSLHRQTDGSWNQKNWADIRNKMTSFFYHEIAGETPHITADSVDSRHYYVSGSHETQWNVDGGMILRIKGNDIWVVWLEEAKQHSLSVSGKNERGYGYNDKKNIKLESKNND